MDLKKRCAIRFLGALLAITSSVHSANALQISVTPSVLNADIGQSIFADVVVSDLGNTGSPSIGAFDISLGFDDSLLDFNSVTFGSGLDLGIFGSFQNFGEMAASIFVDETSFEFEVDLLALQPESFTLFSVQFTTLSAGVSGLDLNVFSIADASGFQNLMPDSINNGTVNIGGVMPIAEPGTLGLMVVGLAGLGITRQRRRQLIEQENQGQDEFSRKSQQVEKMT